MWPLLVAIESHISSILVLEEPRLVCCDLLPPSAKISPPKEVQLVSHFSHRVHIVKLLLLQFLFWRVWLWRSNWKFQFHDHLTFVKLTYFAFSKTWRETTFHPNLLSPKNFGRCRLRWSRFQHTHLCKRAQLNWSLNVPTSKLLTSLKAANKTTTILLTSKVWT